MTRVVLLNAAKHADTDIELLQFPLDETEQLVDGSSTRDALGEAKATAFSKLVDALAQQESPALEKGFVDEGVRMRQFGRKGDAPATLDASFSISKPAKRKEGKPAKINTVIPFAPVPAIPSRHEDEPHCTDVPSSIVTYVSSKQVASSVKATQRDAKQFESKLDAPDDEAKVTAFSKLVDVLAQQESPTLEKAFVDEGVRVRQFGLEGDGPATPDTFFSIVIDDDEEDSSLTLPTPRPKGSRRKSRMKKSKSDSSVTSALQKKTLKSSIWSLTKIMSADAKSQTSAKVDKFSPLKSPREAPEAPPPLVPTSDVLIDATRRADTNSEPLAFPFDEKEELMDGLSFQEFESKRDAPDDEAKALTSPREGSETPPPLESDSWSPTPPYPKSRSESQSSPATIQVSDTSRESFSFRGALDSIWRPSAASSSVQASPLDIESVRPLATERNRQGCTVGLDVRALAVDLGIWG